MKITIKIIILIFLFGCENKQENKEETIKKIDTKIDSISADFGNCFNELFNEIINTNFLDLHESNSETLAKEGILDCFFKRNEAQLGKINSEILIEASKSTEYSATIKVKRWIFSDKQAANYIFKEFSKGFYDQCIGMKEPNFIVIESNNIYIFYVRAEYNRHNLLKLKKAIQEDISKCPDAKLTECK